MCSIERGLSLKKSKKFAKGYSLRSSQMIFIEIQERYVRQKMHYRISGLGNSSFFKPLFMGLVGLLFSSQSCGATEKENQINDPRPFINGRNGEVGKGEYFPISEVVVPASLLEELDYKPAQAEMSKIIQYLAYMSDEEFRPQIIDKLKKDRIDIEGYDLQSFLLKRALTAATDKSLESSLQRYLGALRKKNIGLQEIVKKFQAQVDAQAQKITRQQEENKGLLSKLVEKEEGNKELFFKLTGREEENRRLLLKLSEKETQLLEKVEENGNLLLKHSEKEMQLSKKEEENGKLLSKLSEKEGQLSKKEEENRVLLSTQRELAVQNDTLKKYLWISIPLACMFTCTATVFVTRFLRK